MRDELVRAVMPELRVLVQHLVETAVERSITPLLQRQQALETAIKELRAEQLRSEQQRSTQLNSGRLDANQSLTAHVVQVREPAGSSTRSRPDAPGAPVRNVVVSSTEVAVAPAKAVQRTELFVPSAYDAAALVDVPAELNGSRRKKVLLWSFAIGALLLLLSMIGLSVLSNMGTYL